MLRIIANLLFMAVAAFSAFLLYQSWGESGQGTLVSVVALAGSVFALAVLQGQEKHEHLLERILVVLQEQVSEQDGPMDGLSDRS